MKRGDFFKKNVSRPSNPPDELAQNVSKKNPSRTNYSSIFSAKVQNLAVFFIYLHDSNSIFRAAGINSEIFSARTVPRLDASSMHCAHSALDEVQRSQYVQDLYDLSLLGQWAKRILSVFCSELDLTSRYQSIVDNRMKIECASDVVDVMEYSTPVT